MFDCRPGWPEKSRPCPTSATGSRCWAKCLCRPTGVKPKIVDPGALSFPWKSDPTWRCWGFLNSKNNHMRESCTILSGVSGICQHHGCLLSPLDQFQPALECLIYIWSHMAGFSGNWVISGDTETRKKGCSLHWAFALPIALFRELHLFGRSWCDLETVLHQVLQISHGSHNRLISGDIPWYSVNIS